jgi:hypothetical protein
LGHFRKTDREPPVLHGESTYGHRIFTCVELVCRVASWNFRPPNFGSLGLDIGTLSDTTPCTMRNFPFMKKSKDKKSKAAKEAASPKATPKKQEEDEMASRTLRQIPRRIFHVQSSCSC